jgi:hypothetical protein
LAEMPLVATRLSARRQGHCRVLLRAFEDLLARAGVQCFSLPAAHQTVRARMHMDDARDAPVPALWACSVQRGRAWVLGLACRGGGVASQRAAWPGVEWIELVCHF